MTTAASLSALPVSIQLHIAAAVGALLLGPVALWSRKGSPVHRSAGYVWVGLMLSAAVTSLFIRDFRLPNIAGYTPIHLVTVLTFVGVGTGITAAVQRRIGVHQRAMRRTYIGGCLVAGAFALAPSRFLGHWLWVQTLGWA
ncbi:MAG: DUF2306 domain-containing protein [Aquincola sp.]|nr:DUF2306 domain-containing protein [Aquincola sp.]|tara:strand:- start:458 stop:880 length:423 start_codon:yes stop_codon:yes gene_type:complete